ncbi:altronate dehydratase family protein [Anaerorhabdus sp.]|uniref:UxaA family hydrolase n=1 Tax=Anaerorhabdus sp. TaxID=1872524 RepID=UPI002B1FCD41|nr:altronate dehydratase family protein [Anaerorhabdus sp.]MEA4876240.1 altronate dehydratase family protein [Anaerorhabdus sp.]
MNKKFIKINASDNVIVIVDNVKKDEVIEVDSQSIQILQDTTLGHKIAFKNINENENIIKYGENIGVATTAIKTGEWVHTHNCKTVLNEHEEYFYNPLLTMLGNEENKTFNGYLRSSGKVGVRNEIWILPTVGCVNGIVKELERKAQSLLTDNIDAIVAYNHPYGCSQVGDDQDNTRKILADIASHPNAAYILLVGLGCENSGIAEVLKFVDEKDKNKIRTMICQNIEDEIETGLCILKECVKEAKQIQRTEQPLSKLIVGLKCGGSDGLSGITANPTVGIFSDLLVKQGGSTILTEVPEMFGAERSLMNRCKDEETFKKLVKLINEFKDYFVKNNSPVYENPSPGNKAGGITTLEDKSLGCTQKSGTATVVDVLWYGDKIKQCGLNLLESPGNDLVASTALAAAGAQIILFTTGRGTPFACPVPTIKISSNTPLSKKKNNWIDFDAGISLNDKTLSECGNDLFKKVISVANGEKIKSEADGYRDIAIFKKGVTL